MNILKEKFTKKVLKQGLKIYNYYIKNSFSNFEEKVLSFETYYKLYRTIKSNNLPYLLLKIDEEIIGIAFVNKFREKSGYRYTFEHSIYINNKHVNNGYGSFILKELIKECKKNKKIKNLIAVIGSSKNISSIKLHKKNGFKYIGTLNKIGFKKNKWIDSVYMQKVL